MDAGAKKYCPSCGEHVGVEASLEGAYLLTACGRCGLGLGVKVANAQEVQAMAGRSAPAPAPAPVNGVPPRATPSPQITTSGSMERLARGPSASDEAMASYERSAAGVSAESTPRAGGAVKQMRRVYLVEDSDFLRQVARDLLTERQLAREVVDLPDGQAFLEAFTRATAAGNKPDLVILDVRMPEIDGRDAARAMRAIELGIGVKRTPILFFSGVLCDEPFKALLKELGNAKYIRKAESGDVQKLGERIVAVLQRLVGARKAG